MPATPEFLAARAAEARQRLLGYLPCPEPIRLPARTGSILDFAAVHLTPRHVVELTFARNGFFTSGSVSPLDALQVLWRLHPLFVRPDGSMANRPGASASFRDRIRCGFARARLNRRFGRLAWPATALALQHWLDRAYQDAPRLPGEAAKHRRSPLLPDFNWIDDLCDYHGRNYGTPISQVLDTPLSILFQLQRNQRLLLPDGELSVYAPSDLNLLSSR